MKRDPFKNLGVLDMAPRVRKAEEKAVATKRKAIEKAKIIVHTKMPTPPPPLLPPYSSSPPPPSPPPLPIISSTSLLGLPSGAFMPPHIYATIVKIKAELDGLEEDFEKDGVKEMYKKYQIDGHTFIYLWPLEIQAGLRDQKGLDLTRQKRDRWSAFCLHGQTVLKEIVAIIGLWAPSASLQDMLRWNMHLVESFLRFLQLLVLLIEEEVLVWHTKGQWVPTSDNSVKEALVKVIMMLHWCPI